MIPQTTHTASALIRLMTLRHLAVIGLLVVLLLCTTWLQLDLDLKLMLPAIATFLLANVLAQYQIRKKQQISAHLLFVHLVVDLSAMSWLLYCSGGASNPFASLLLLPITIAAISLPSHLVWVMTILSLSFYALLVFFNLPLPQPHGPLLTLDQVLAESCSIGGHEATDAPSAGFALHIVGMWLNFVISAFIIGFFLLKQSRALRQREDALHTFRERALRQEKVLGMGLMAAGAAHKLGTPLSTLAVMLGEAINDTQSCERLSTSDLKLMQTQVDRCKSILADMVEAASPQTRHPVSATAWLAEWVDEWHVLRPAVARPHFEIHTPAGLREPFICPDRGLDQALQGLLDNAADAVASHHPDLTPEANRLHIEIEWDTAVLRIKILDRGPGITEELAELLGARFVSTKQHPQDAAGHVVGGMGIGFFLTNATIERFSGRVELFPRADGGTCTCVELPLSGLHLQPWKT